jgi:uncharacterized protein
MGELTQTALLMQLAALEPVLRAEGIVRLSLIGSRARGDHRDESDIDLLVDIEAGRRFSLLHLVGVGHIIEDTLHLPSSVIERRSLPKRFLDDVQADEITVFG